jgi:hypothetical protein
LFNHLSLGYKRVATNDYLLNIIFDFPCKHGSDLIVILQRLHNQLLKPLALGPPHKHPDHMRIILRLNFRHQPNPEEHIHLHVVLVGDMIQIIHKYPGQLLRLTEYSLEAFLRLPPFQLLLRGQLPQYHVVRRYLVFEERDELRDELEVEESREEVRGVELVGDAVDYLGAVEGGLGEEGLVAGEDQTDFVFYVEVAGAAHEGYDTEQDGVCQGTDFEVGEKGVELDESAY